MSQAATAGLLDEFTHVEEDDTEYLVDPVVAQKPGVYTYPDPDGGVRREFVSSEELQEATETHEEKQLLLRHPETPEGNLSLTTDPRANYEVVGKWKVGLTDDGNSLGGRAHIDVDEIGEHDGNLRRYLKRRRQEGIGEVSTGYDIKQAVKNPGRFNGIKYSYEQEGLLLDHLALLVDEEGDCSREDGCGLGRANEREDERMRLNHQHPTDDADKSKLAEDIDPDELGPEGRLNTLIELGKSAARSIGLGDLVEEAPTEKLNQSTSVHTPDFSGTTESSWEKPSFGDFKGPYNLNDDETWSDLDGDMRSAIAEHYFVSVSGFPPDEFGDLKLPAVEPSGELNLNALDSVMKMASQTDGVSSDQVSSIKSSAKRMAEDNFDVDWSDRENMEDEKRINQLVEEHGFTRENISHLSGTECLKRIHETMVEQDGDSGNMEGDNDGAESGDDSGLSEDAREEVTKIVEESVPSADEIAEEISPEVEVEDVDEDEIVDEVTEQVEQVRAHQENVEIVVESDELPHIDEDRAERMNEDVVAELAEDVESEDEEESRTNRSGIPGGSSFNMAEFSDDNLDADIPAPGEDPREADD